MNESPGRSVRGGLTVQSLLRALLCARLLNSDATMRLWFTPSRLVLAVWGSRATNTHRSHEQLLICHPEAASGPKGLLFDAWPPPASEVCYETRFWTVTVEQSKEMRVPEARNNLVQHPSTALGAGYAKAECWVKKVGNIIRVPEVCVSWQVLVLQSQGERQGSVSRFFAYDPNQAYVLPPNVSDVLGGEHLCFFQGKTSLKSGFEGDGL